MANEYTPVISSLTLPNGGGKYYFKDAYAREMIEELVTYSGFLGVTTDNISDGSTLNPVNIVGSDDPVTAISGSIVIKGDKEFIWNGSAWAEFGDLSSITDLLGELAYEDTASTTYTPEGDVTGSFTIPAESFTATGTVASQSITVEQALSGEATYTPAGNVSVSVSGVSGTIEFPITPYGEVVIAEILHAQEGNNYTPEGSISLPEVEVSTTPTTVLNEVTSAGTLPSLTGGLLSVSIGTGNDSENLIFTLPSISEVFSAGAMPTFGSTSVVGSIDSTSYSGSATFSGTAVTISASFQGTSSTYSSSFTPSVTVTSTSFEGSGARLIATVASAGVTVTNSSAYTGDISASFAGTSSTITVSAPSEG